MNLTIPQDRPVHPAGQRRESDSILPSTVTPLRHPNRSSRSSYEVSKRPTIRSKLFPPRPAANCVSRDALLLQLDKFRSHRLAVVRAPAGYGKTSLLAQWRQRLFNGSAHVAWCSLDTNDNDENTFLSYLAAALQTAECAAGERAIALYRHGQDRSADAFVATLVNELESFGKETVLFLDDFHRITNAPIISAVRQLVRYAPYNFHIVISSQTLPAIGVLELQIQETALVIDVDSLRFSAEEARRFLQTHVARLLDEDELRHLWDRTEGWPAGLQLAALSINDGMSFYRRGTRLTGVDTQLATYFSSAILDGYEYLVQEFLLKTSLLFRFNADLADSVLGRRDSAQLLQRLERGNAFLIRLPGETPWYRYHPLFAEFLGARFKALCADSARCLLRSASQFCESQGLLLDAVHYALACGMREHAAELVESCALRMVQDGELKNYLSLIDDLGEAVLDHRPVLRVAQAWALALSNRPAHALQILATIEAPPTPDSVLLENILIVKGLCDLFNGDAPACAAAAARWQSESSKTDPFLTSVGCNLLSLTRSQAGDFEQAREVLVAPRKWSDSERSFYASCYANCLLAYSYAQRGAMKVAESVYRSELERCNQHCGRRSAPACTTASFYAAVLYETAQFDSLRDLLADRIDVISEVALPEALFATLRARARLLWLDGQLEEALAALERLQLRAETRGHFLVHAGCLAERTELHLSVGEIRTSEKLLEELFALAERADARARTGDCGIPRAHAIALIRLRMRQGEWTWALRASERLLEDGRTPLGDFERMRVELMRGRILQALGKDDEALPILHTLLQHGERLGVVRVFADEWPSGGPLLARIIEETINHSAQEYLARVRSGFGATPNVSACVAPSAVDYANTGLVEEISERETRVLRLLGKGLQNKQIADQLHITLNTVKWHLKNAYAKLNVTQRGGAVARARKLGII